MQELLPGLWHWTAWHPNIGARVHSYYFEPAGALIDPMLPEEGRDWFRERPPRLALLTNRLHYRHSGEFDVPVLCHRAGLHEFVPQDGVRGFEHGARLPGHIRALEIGALCPEETAFALPGGILALGDSVIRENGKLAFVPDELMGEDPEGVKAGLRDALSRAAERPFVALLLAHGEPALGECRAELREFLGPRTAARTGPRRPKAGAASARGSRGTRRPRRASSPARRSR